MVVTSATEAMTPARAGLFRCPGRREGAALVVLGIGDCKGVWPSLDDVRGGELALTVLLAGVCEATRELNMSVSKVEVEVSAAEVEVDTVSGAVETDRGETPVGGVEIVVETWCVKGKTVLDGDVPSLVLSEEVAVDSALVEAVVVTVFLTPDVSSVGPLNSEQASITKTPLHPEVSK